MKLDFLTRTDNKNLAYVIVVAFVCILLYCTIAFAIFLNSRIKTQLASFVCFEVTFCLTFERWPVLQDQIIN